MVYRYVGLYGITKTMVGNAWTELYLDEFHFL